MQITPLLQWGWLRKTIPLFCIQIQTHYFMAFWQRCPFLLCKLACLYMSIKITPVYRNMDIVDGEIEILPSSIMFQENLFFLLKIMRTSFIISVEGNGDFGLSPLPQTETYVNQVYKLHKLSPIGRRGQLFSVYFWLL